MNKRNTVVALLALVVVGCGERQDEAAAFTVESAGATPYGDSVEEPRLRNLRQLTDGGTNAEAYFSADGQQLIFQMTRDGVAACDQIFTMDVDGTNVRRVSTGEGRTTCGYFFPGGDRIVYSSTHHLDAVCPTPPDRSRGYVWGLFDYAVFVANSDGSDLTRITHESGYNAEATISPDGSTIVFTSDRDGDLEIYTMGPDGSNVTRLTHEPGYDGGAFFTADGTQIVYRARRPESDEELADYQALLEADLIRPGALDIYIMNADGSDKRRVTDNGAANFAPFPHPNGRQIIFSSNMDDPTGRRFALYAIDFDGTGLERVTTYGNFNSFPMFSPDGTQLVFSSDRGGTQDGDINVFIAEWVE